MWGEGAKFAPGTHWFTVVEGKPPGAAAETRPHWAPQALVPISWSLLKYLWEQGRNPEGPRWLHKPGGRFHDPWTTVGKVYFIGWGDIKD